MCKYLQILIRTSNFLTLAVNTDACPRYLLLAHKSSFHSQIPLDFACWAENSKLAHSHLLWGHPIPSISGSHWHIDSHSSWTDRFAPILTLIWWSLLNFAHAMTAVLSWHVQNSVVMAWNWNTWKLNLNYDTKCLGKMGTLTYCPSHN